MKPFAWTRFLLIVSLALNLGVVVALLARPALLQPPAAATHANVDLPDYLQLTAEQRARWHALEPDFLRDLENNWHEIQRHREALIRHIFAPSPDRAAIAAEQDAIARLQAVQQQRVVTQMLTEREFLNDAQRTRL